MAQFVIVVGEEVVQAMIQPTLEPWPVLISVHRDITCWMSSFVSRPDFAFGAALSTLKHSALCHSTVCIVSQV